MPIFPSISTLSQKPHLTGEEVIQISATEKTTLLQLVNQLGFNLSSVLTGLDSIPRSPGINVPTEEDSLLSALSKLIGWAGDARVFIMPTFSDTLVHPAEHSEKELRLIILADLSMTTDPQQAGYIARLSFRARGINLKIASYNQPFEDLGVEQLDQYITDYETQLSWEWNYNCDKDKETSDSEFIVRPGEIIVHNGDSITGIEIDHAEWVVGAHGTFSQYNATIVTQVNVTKSMFTAYAGDLNDVTYLFMDDFDSNPGTTLQCITIQRIRVASRRGIILLVNKCGYIS